MRVFEKNGNNCLILDIENNIFVFEKCLKYFGAKIFFVGESPKETQK